MAGNKTKNEKKEREETNFFGMMTQIMLSSLFALTGALMLFVPGMKSLYFLYVTSGVLLVAGAWLMFRFFLKKGYQRITDYNFSIGLLIFVFGVVVLIRAGDMTEFFTTLLGILIAMEAAILLQLAIQIIGLHGKAWPLPMFSAIIVLAYSLLVLTGYKGIFKNNETLFYGCLFGSGLLGLISLIAAAGRSHSFKKEEQAREEAMRADVEADYVIADEPEKKPEPLPEVKTESLPEKETETAGHIPDTESSATYDTSVKTDTMASASKEEKKGFGFFGKKAKDSTFSDGASVKQGAGNESSGTSENRAEFSGSSSAEESSTAIHTDLFTDDELRLLSDEDDNK